MKKIVPLLALVVMFTACKSRSEADKTQVVLLQDTTGNYASDILTDKRHDEQLYGSTIGGAVQTTTPVKYEPGKTITNKKTTVNSSSTATAPVTAKKKGWSHRARGAAVGAGTGAITGAIVNKNNRGVGAIIGAVVGAASGYVIGNEVDKKKDRQKSHQ